jgi:PAS domain S-box-containing protein
MTNGNAVDGGEVTRATSKRRTADWQAQLLQSEKRLRGFVAASNDVIYRMSPDWTEMLELDGRGFISDTEQARRDWLSDYIHPDDQNRVQAAIAEAIRTKSVFELEHRVKRWDGTLGWTLSRAIPLLDDDGEISEWFGAASDITARRQALDDLARVIADSERQKNFYESLISNTPDLVYAFDRNYRFLFANDALLKMWDRSLAESIGKRLIEVGYEPWHAEMHEREIDRVVATKQPIRGEVGFPHATLGRRTYDYIFTPVMDANGEVQSIAGTTRDITDIKRTEEHLQLLVNELNHRVKNTLATIQSIAAQTFRPELADPRAKAEFESRLLALSSVHSVLTDSNWESASLTEIATRAMAPFRDDTSQPDRFEVAGDDVQLVPKMALAIAMALHELASNAVKYGALGIASGRVTLHWTFAENSVHMTWCERGGPKVDPPTRRGFGTRLIEQGLARELNGSVRLDYQPSGVVCIISFPT